MELFEYQVDPTHNLLPKDGVVLFYPNILSQVQSVEFFKELKGHIEWRHDEAVIYGKKIVTRRKVAWYGDRPFAYTYSRTTKTALYWTPALQELKTIVEKVSGETYNSCLLNLYHNGTEGMAWHSDGEAEMKKNGAIASLSLGAERKFSFRHKFTKEKMDLILPNGSMLVMKDVTQSYWQHCLPVSKRVLNARINLTFRTIDLNS
jgi:alkylated DNA repair dioxygenase AlkB